MKKNYLISVDCFDKNAVRDLDPKQLAALALEFGGRAARQARANVSEFIRRNGLRDEVGFLSQNPGISPLFFISCTENAALQLQAAQLDKVGAIFEATMPLELSDWHKHLKPLQPRFIPCFPAQGLEINGVFQPCVIPR